MEPIMQSSDKLRALLQIDVDACAAYELALTKIDLPCIHGRLAEFQEDHQRHIRELAQALADLGDDAAVPDLDMKGLFLEAMTALRSISGSEGALHAIRTSEEMNVTHYLASLDFDLPAELRELIRRHFDDEQRHLHYIEQTLELRQRATSPSLMEPVFPGLVAELT